MSVFSSVGNWVKNGLGIGSAPQAQRSYWGGGDQQVAADFREYSSDQADRNRSAADANLAADVERSVEQGQLADRYRAMAAGEGPSLAVQQLRDGQARATADAQQTAASARGGGGNQVLAQREAQRQAAIGQAAVQGQMAEARTREQLGAMQGEGELLGQRRQGDMARAAAYLGREDQYYQGQLAQDQAQLSADSGVAAANLQSESAQRGRAAGTFQSLMGAASRGSASAAGR